MTEDEAKTKRCPVGAGHLAKVGEIGLVPLNVYATNCIGSACMAWRNTETISPFKSNISVKDHWERHGYTVAETDEPETILVTPPKTDAGFCGLAGRP